MKSSPRFAAPLAAMIALAAAGYTFAQDYDVIQIPNLPGWPNMTGNDINDKGEVTGNAFLPWGWSNRAFYFDGTTTHDFTAELIDAQPPEYFFVFTRGMAINNSSHILFNLEIVDVGVFPYIWTGDAYREVTPDIPDGADAGANWLNNNGIVAGAYREFVCCWSPEYRAFIWDMNSGQTTVIIPPPPYTTSTAFHVSDSGWVTGFVMGGDTVARGYLWKDGVFTLMEPFDEEDFLSISNRVNDAGIAAGFTSNSPPPGTPSMSRALLWTASEGVLASVYPMPGLSGFDVRGLNNSNEVVGTMYGPQQAFHWHNGVIRKLNDHVSSPLPGTILDIWEAGAINEKGQITVEANYLGGDDWNNYAFVLTPKATGPVGDLNGDGVVDVFDLLMLLGAWGPCPSGDCPADLNGDGGIDVFDLLILLGNWG
jgi:hypothetical protein